MAYEYIGEGDTAQNMFFADTKFAVYIFLWIVVSIVFIYCLHLILKKLSQREKQSNIKNQLVWFIIFILLFAAGIRGRISLAPMDWGIAYFSSNHTLNQSALNGIYTLGRNYLETSHDPRLSFLSESERFPFVDKQTALNETQKTLAQQDAEFIEPAKSLKRAVTTKPNFNFRPNIVIIVMEGWSGSRTSALGDNLNLTPCFDSLADNGIFFVNFYANGSRTNYGLGAILCSYPALPGRSILKRYDSQHPFISLSEILQLRGYTNLFYYGGDFAFDNMEGFFRQKGYTTFYGEESFSSDDYFSKWGVPDHILFEYINDAFDTLPRPFQLTALTLSNHEPFDLPDSSVQRFFNDSYSEIKANSIIYADRAIGKFIEEAKTKPIFDSTIFIFVPDHSLQESSKMPLNPNLFHIPLLIYSPNLLSDSSVIVETFGSQIDILPTLMGILGGDYIHESWGRDLLNLSDDDNGFAIISLWDRIGYLDESIFYFEQVGQYKKLYSNGGRQTPSSAPTQFREIEFDSTDYRFLARQRFLHIFTQLADQMTLPAKK